MTLRIMVDENIPYAREVFGPLGELNLRPGRGITADEIKTIDALIIRSVTRVNEELLAGSSVRFVGTATIGMDHVDIPYLQSRGIRFASAPGSNANSVAEYVVAALLEIAVKTGGHLEGASIAIVGVGNVGSRVLQKAEALQMRCFLNDPPRFRESGESRFLMLGEALRDADFVTLHVPLTREGPDATYLLANDEFFRSMKPGAVFLNTSRGDVADEAALKRALSERQLARAVLDVWQGEPIIDPEMAKMASMATPHIAGYSLEGKAAATVAIGRALCEWVKQPMAIQLESLLPAVSENSLDLTGLRETDESLLCRAVHKAYDIRSDDQALRTTLMTGENRGRQFDLMRKIYPDRREFPSVHLIAPRERAGLLQKAAALGFRVKAI